MRKSTNKIQRMLTTLFCVSIVMGVQGCSKNETIEEFKKVEILEGKWHINIVIGHPENDNKIFFLSKIDLEGENFVWGTTILIKDKNFVCSYTAPCGNDCFPSSEGQIGKINEKQIKISVKQFEQTGDCEKKYLKLNKNLGVYSVERISKKEIKLVKVE